MMKLDSSILHKELIFQSSCWRGVLM